MVRHEWNLWRGILGWGVLCVGLGALTSVVVAWGTALALPPNGITGGLEQSGASYCDGNRSWTAWNYMPIAFGSDLVGTLRIVDKSTSVVDDKAGTVLEYSGGWGPVRASVRPPPFLIPGMHDRWGYTSDFVLGWPARCLWFESPMQGGGCIVSHDRPVLHKIDFKRGWLGLTPRGQFDAVPDGLPTGVLWPGLLLNTAAYSGAWLAVFVVPMQIRRRMSARAGQCRKCRYDLRGLNPGSACPECGTPQTASPMG